MLTGALINLALATGLEPTPFWVIAPLVLYASGMSLAMPNLSLMALDLFPAHRGLTSALLGFLQTGSNALVAGLLAPLLAPRLPTLAGGMLVLSATGFVLWRLACRRHWLPASAALP